MKKSFKTYSEEKSKDETYDSIISKSEFNQYLTSIKCRFLRVRYNSNDKNWMEIEMLD